MALDRETLVSIVQEDLRAGLGEVFEFADDGLGSLDTFGELDEPIGSSSYEVLPWQWAGRHIGTLAGIPPTGRTAVIRGVTIVDHREGEPLFHRFVDWLGLFDQLGAALVTRPPVDEFPGELPLRDRFGVLDDQRVGGYGES